MKHSMTVLVLSSAVIRVPARARRAEAPYVPAHMPNQSFPACSSMMILFPSVFVQPCFDAHHHAEHRGDGEDEQEDEP